MSTTPHAIHNRFWWRLLPSAVFMAFGLVLTPAPGGLWGQSAAAPSPGQPAVQIEVLDVSTGTGSKTQAPGATGAGAESGTNNHSQPQSVIPAIPTALTGVTPTPPRQLTPEERELMAKYSSLISALEQWHRQVQANYRVDVTMLADPFMPIKEVRGNPSGNDGDAVEEDLSLPAILRLDLSQLKLVAITILSNNPGGAWASFEDGAGNSYILKIGDRIGRNHGKIVKISPSVVTVEETGRRGTDKPRITEIKLSVLSRDGVTVNK